MPAQDTQAILCKEFDQFVLDGFGSQPFMRGFPPHAVQKLLKRKESVDLLTTLRSLLARAELCSAQCDDLIHFYTRLAALPEWRHSLLKLSQATQYSDAILLPLLSDLRQEQIDDRGLLIARRSMKAHLLLIDIQSAELIWFNSRYGQQSKSQLRNKGAAVFPAFPTWEHVLKQILAVDLLWKDYPGKIIN